MRKFMVVGNFAVNFLKGVVKMLQSLKRQMRVCNTLNWDQLKARGKDAMQWDLIKIIFIGVSIICFNAVLNLSWSFGAILLKLWLGWTGLWTGVFAYRIFRDVASTEIYKTFYVEETKVRRTPTATVED